MTVNGLLDIIGSNGAKSPDELEKILHSLRLARKSSELLVQSPQSDTASTPLLLAVERTTREWLTQVIQPKYSDDATRQQQLEMDRHWSAQRASFQYYVTLQGEYDDFLPGRLLIYLELAERILGHWQTLETRLHGRVQEVEALELGSGSATLSHLLAKKKGAHATLVDLSHGALDFARYLAEVQFNTEEKIDVEQTDMFTYDPNKSFDIVYNGGVFEHYNVEKQKELLSKMKILTRDGGVVVVAVPNRNSPLFNEAREETTKKSFFSSISDYLYPQPYKDSPDLPKRFMEAGLEIIEEGGLSLAPSVVTRRLCEQTATLYKGYVGKFRPASVADTITMWHNIDTIVRIIHPDMMKDNGWYHYAIGRKS